MIAAAAEYLETEGENTFFLAVGAGHMVDPGGIVSGLRGAGLHRGTGTRGLTEEAYAEGRRTICPAAC